MPTPFPKLNIKQSHSTTAPAVAACWVIFRPGQGNPVRPNKDRMLTSEIETPLQSIYCLESYVVIAARAGIPGAMLVSGSIQIRLLTTFGMVSWPAIRASMTAQDTCHGFWCQEKMQFPLKLHQGQEAIRQFMQTDVRRIAFFGPTRVLSHLPNCWLGVRIYVRARFSYLFRIQTLNTTAAGTARQIGIRRIIRVSWSIRSILRSTLSCLLYLTVGCSSWSLHTQSVFPVSLF
jgi:hypothetical protein